MTVVLSSILLVIFFAIMIGVGIYTRKSATDVNGFVLGGRSVGPWLTAFAFGTSYFSAVIFVGYAGQFGWLYGTSATWAGLGNAFIGSLLAWKILGRRTRIMTQSLDTKTMPDFFGKRFESTGLKIAASVIIFIFLIPYTASLYNGLSSLFGLVFDMPYWVVIAVMAVLTGIYVIFGGYMATAINDFIQGIVMLFGIVIVIASVLMSKGGFMQATADLSQIQADGTALNGAFTAFLGPDPLSLLFVVILTSLGTWGLPQMVGKFYSIKSEDSVRKGTIISTFFAIIVAGGCYFLGGFARLFEPEKTAAGKILFDSIVPSMLKDLNPIVIGIVIVLVLSASMSTLSSLVLTSSSTLTLDVIVPSRKKETSEKSSVLIMRLFIVFFIVISALMAVIKDANPGFTFIAQMMGVSWGALAGAFLAPFLYGLYWKRTSKAAVTVCFIYGTVLMIFQMYVSLSGMKFENAFMAYMFNNSIRSGVLAMVGGLVIVPIVSLFTKAPEKELVEGAFSCYNKEVVTVAKDSLGEA